MHVAYFNDHANIIETLYNKFKLFPQIILDLRYQNRAIKQVAHYKCILSILISINVYITTQLSKTEYRLTTSSSGERLALVQNGDSRSVPFDPQKHFHHYTGEDVRRKPIYISQAKFQEDGSSSSGSGPQSREIKEVPIKPLLRSEFHAFFFLFFQR